jgi:hypothetical protein
VALRLGNVFGARSGGLRSQISPGPSGQDQSTLDHRLVAIVFLLAAIILIVRAWVGRSGMPFFADTDDAMRMVMVQEFLAGQNWFDLTAHRLNTPFGAELHWSRLIDLPLAVLLLVFTPVFGNDSALLVAGSVWPMALLGVLLWLSARLALRLVGREGVLPALILPVLSPAITAEFTPGRVDHHSVVVVLTLAIAWASVEAIKRPRFAIIAGMLTATALAIATESLPSIAAAIVVFGLGFVFDASRRTAMRNFGLAFGLGSAVHLAIFRPPPRWLEPACDVLSPVYCALALLVALVFTLPALLPPIRALWQRFAILALPGGAGLLALGLAYPQCLSGPYAALDPWLQANWIAGIIEAKPWLSNLQDMPAYAIAVGMPILLAILVVLGRLWRVREGRAEWAVLLVFLAMTTLVMLAQVRGARLAIMPAIPAAAWLIVAARQRYLAKASLGNVAALLGSWLAFSGVVLALTVNGILAIAPSTSQQVAVSSQPDTNKCLLPSAFTSLAELPPQRIMAPVDLGAHIMLYTPHEVVAAPYHRNQQGVRDAFRFLNEPIGHARSLLAERGISLVVICPGMPEMAGIPSRAPDSFVSLFWADNLPNWLENKSKAAGPLRIWAVVP